MLFLSLVDFSGILRTILMAILFAIYDLIAGLYNLFIYISQIPLFDDSTIEAIYNKFQVILYVVMVFYISFQVVKYTVNPDLTSDKEKGTSGLIKRAVIMVFMMAFMNSFIFKNANKIRTKLVSSDIIANIILVDQDSSDYKSTNKGKNFSGQMLDIFYNVNSKVDGNSKYKCKNKETPNNVVKKNIENFKKGTATQSDFKYCLESYEIDGVEESYIEVNWLLAIAAGIGIVYVLSCYCLDAAKVLFQLAFLQIISPIPIMCYLSPNKDGMFPKWAKMTAFAYFDTVIRLFIIYMMLFFCDLLLTAFNDGSIFSKVPNVGTGYEILIKVFLVVGLLFFALEAPKMIKNLLPKSLTEGFSGFGFGKDAREARRRAKNAAIGGVTGAGRTVGRAIQRGKHNLKNFRNPLQKGAGFKQNAKNVGVAAYNRAIGRRVNVAKAIRKARSDGNEAVDTAKNKYEAALRSGNADLIRKKRMEYENSKIKRKADVLQEKQNQFKDLHNTNYQSVIVGAASGLVTGVISGVKSGANDKKYVSVNKALNNVGAEFENERKLETIYEDGGSTLNMVRNFKTGINKITGSDSESIETLKKTIEKNSKQIDEAIKIHDEASKSVSNVKKATISAFEKNYVKDKDIKVSDLQTGGSVSGIDLLATYGSYGITSTMSGSEALDAIRTRAKSLEDQKTAYIGAHPGIDLATDATYQNIEANLGKAHSDLGNFESDVTVAYNNMMLDDIRNGSTSVGKFEVGAYTSLYEMIAKIEQYKKKPGALKPLEDASKSGAIDKFNPLVYNSIFVDGKYKNFADVKIAVKAIDYVMSELNREKTNLATTSVVLSSDAATEKEHETPISVGGSGGSSGGKK